MAGNMAQTPTTGVYFTSHIIPEYWKIVAMALLPITAIILALAKKRRERF
ncbi:MAG: hypothetical protein QXT10_04685 [Candidatus Bathyarchaeia archaeon]